MPKTEGIAESTGGTWILGSSHSDAAKVWTAADKSAGTAAQAVTVYMALIIGETEMYRPMNHELLWKV